MLEFRCTTCREPLQGDDTLGGKFVRCPLCSNAMTVPLKSQLDASPETAIATPDDAVRAKVIPLTDSSEGAFREGEPPPDPLPQIYKEIPRIAMGWASLFLVLAVAGLAVALLMPATRYPANYAQRTQSINNLKNIGLAFHAFHDTHKHFPFNGTVAAVPGDHTTGSWAFQVLPYIDQAPLFDKPNTTSGVAAYMCPGRGRPAVSTTGAWTDYMINTWLNDPDQGAVNAPDSKRTLAGITDGTGNTIMVGHGSVDPELYTAQATIAQSNDIFQGGHTGTARLSTTNQIDTPNDRTPNWGGPFPWGALMAMGDATVRMFPYNTFSGGVIVKGVSTVTTPGLGAFLTPAGGEAVLLPDS